jgi:hypothetical protein
MHVRTVKRDPLAHGWSLRVDELWRDCGSLSQRESFAVHLEHVGGGLVPPGFDGRLKTDSDVELEAARLIAMSDLGHTGQQMQPTTTPKTK